MILSRLEKVLKPLLLNKRTADYTDVEMSKSRSATNLRNVKTNKQRSIWAQAGLAYAMSIVRKIRRSSRSYRPPLLAPSFSLLPLFPLNFTAPRFDYGRRSYTCLAG